MSAIFGLWRLDGRPVEPSSCSAMSRRLEHRGSVGEWIWHQGSVGMGGRSLGIGGEEASAGKERNLASGDILATVDARLDNREELASALLLPPGQVTDEDLILASYRTWGRGCPERWIGDFAVAIWDLGRRRLFCARDPFGVKPLYYHHTPGRLFAFASEIGALLALEDVPDEMDEDEVARHLLVPIGSEPSTTYYRHIRRLEPAHDLVVSQQGLESNAYWAPDPSKELRLSSDSEYAEALRQTFVEAVRCRMRGTPPVACMLSGGIDSASIACVAAGLLEEGTDRSKLHSLSAVYPTVPESDERGFIQDVLERYPMVPHFFEADAANPIVDIDRINELVGGASWGANLYLNWMLYGVAAQSGARVVLDGFDGDSTLSHGVMYLSELARSGRWLKLARNSFPYSRRHGRPVVPDYVRIVRQGLRRPVPGSAIGSFLSHHRGGRSDRARPLRVANRYSLLNRDFARRFSNRTSGPPDPPESEREFHLRKLRNPVLFETIGWLEACAAGRGVEVRLPFCDVRLVELCLSFPPEQKLRKGWTRYVMRRAMEGILPPTIQWRETKAVLHAGWSRALRSNENGRIEAMLARPSPLVRQYLNPEAVRGLRSRSIEGKTSADEEQALWRALSLALWLSNRD